MRLMVVAARSGPLMQAAKLAEQSDAGVICANGVADAIDLFSTGSRADIILVDAALGIRELKEGLRTNRWVLPIFACGRDASATIARDAIRAGASEYLPIPADVHELAMFIEALAREDDLHLRPITRASIH
jgi:two-component system response regulator HydG